MFDDRYSPRSSYVAAMRCFFVIPAAFTLLFLSCYWNLLASYLWWDHGIVLTLSRWGPPPTPFSTKTRYDATVPFSPDEFTDLNSLPQCTLVQMNGLYRHGTRYPMATEYAKMQELLHSLQDNYRDALPSWLQKYNFSYSANASEGLTPSGVSELAGLGQRARHRVDKHHFPKDYNRSVYTLEHTRIARTKASAIAFADAFFTNSDDVEYIVKPAGEDIDLRFFDNCPKYTSEVRGNKAHLTVETKKFESSTRGSALLADIRAALNLPAAASLSFGDLKTIYDSCSYEVAILNKNSTWCRLFSAHALFLLDFYADLKKYYECGTGYPIAYEIAGPLLRHMLETMRAVVDGSTSTRGYFRFAHAETVLPLVCLLGLCTDTKLIAAFSDDAISHRVFQVAAISPFAGNVVFDLYDCAGDARVQLRLNERIVPLEFCGQKGYCTLQELEAHYAHATSYDFAGNCKV
ncbi:multiple inositol polyphosphate phosphatase [Achlya hypogyna]|uniref:Multiple inositol polyphosphate phosphatase 1 n=1 Tax=Achlya hypogyna TaxID=1202772 RepID=A0A1V9YWH3_ACHHY|nr:multiple inositol polyphosphate phosphatase [Achlya hypogyna]